MHTPVFFVGPGLRLCQRTARVLGVERSGHGWSHSRVVAGSCVLHTAIERANRSDEELRRFRHTSLGLASRCFASALESHCQPQRPFSSGVRAPPSCAIAHVGPLSPPARCNHADCVAPPCSLGRRGRRPPRRWRREPHHIEARRWRDPSPILLALTRGSRGTRRRGSRRTGTRWARSRPAS